jgi:peptidoglycan hydrolase-like protein with peptidoglycan-binding domain
MPSEFEGNPAPLTDADFERAATTLGCSVAAVRAVAEVESRGKAFGSDNRPPILYERFWFHRLTGGKWTKTHSHLSWYDGRPYGKSSEQYGKLEEAMTLDREAALKSASWGAFQIMGFNHELAGHGSVESFVKAMVSSTGSQLDAFVAFIQSSHLDDELRRLDWSAFARGYNGEDYRQNKYDEKMASAYAVYSQGGARIDNPFPVLKMGDKGKEVLHLQDLLGIAMDGDFGPGTKAAVAAFQKKGGLYSDGIVGGQTWSALLASNEKKPGGKKATADKAGRSRAPLRLGDRGEDVAFLQTQLGIAADGDFGPNSREAVMKFQKKKGLTADGVVGRKTWDALLAG